MPLKMLFGFKQFFLQTFQINPCFWMFANPKSEKPSLKDFIAFSISVALVSPFPGFRMIF